jgi:hydroxyethylthiazole kinase-like uncharacterized protein yjeF
MKIFSAAQIREADEFTIEHEPIKSINLMERASRAFADWFEVNFDKSRCVYIFCGTGNNGGDGLAIARMLTIKNWKAKAITVKKSSKSTQDFTFNYLKLAEVHEVADISRSEDLKINLTENDIVIDAIFGSGLTRPVRGIYSKVIAFINNSKAEVVSVDVPSGLFIDRHSGDGEIICADRVLSFQHPKLAFLMPENQNYVKSWSTIDIGLHPDYIRDTATPYEFVDQAFVTKTIKPRSKFAHKGNYGSALIVAGSYGKIGASVLCAKACMKAGAGLVTAHVPACGYQIMQTSVPEVMVTTDFGERFLSGLPDLSHYDAIGIGPGIEKHSDTFEVVAQLLSNFHKPVVVDADAINIIAIEKSFLKKLPEGSILTPHPGEFKRLAGPWSDDFEKLEKQISLSKSHKVYIVLKGAHTSVTSPEGKVFFNATGNPGMATGGSGDVLTGMITSFLGQGYAPEEAAILGVYLHGLAGDLGALNLGEESLMASDIISYIPQAVKKLKK